MKNLDDLGINVGDTIIYRSDGRGCNRKGIVSKITGRIIGVPETKGSDIFVWCNFQNEDKFREDYSSINWMSLSSLRKGNFKVIPAIKPYDPNQQPVDSEDI